MLSPTILKSEFYAAKYDYDQNLIWAKKITQGNASITEQFNGFDIDQNGNVYLTGALVGGSKTFGFGEPNQTTLVGPPIVTSFEGLFFLAKLNSANGELVWVKSASSVGSTSNPLGIFGHDIVCDNSGGVIVVGNFLGTASFGSLSNIRSNNESNLDGFVVKYNQSNGSEVWVRKGPTGPLLNVPNAVDVDGVGNIYFTGNFLGSADIIGIVNTENVTVPAGSDFEMFVAKFDAIGEVIWAKQTFSSIGLFLSPPSTAGTNIATDATGNSYITGTLQAQSIIFENFSGSFGDNVPTFYLAKINSSGSFQWIKQADAISATSSSGSYVSIGSNDNPFVSGGFGGTYSFDGIPIISISSHDNFIVNYDKSNGQLICLKHPKPETGSDEAFIGPITSNGNNVLYAVGKSTGIANYGNIDAEITPGFFPTNRTFITMSEECCVLEDRIENITYNDTFSFYGEDSKNLLIAGFDAGIPAISGDVIISSNSNVHYTSEGRITLKPGFHSLNGSKFKASIADCGNTFTQNNNRLGSVSNAEEIVDRNNGGWKVYRIENPYSLLDTESSVDKFTYENTIDKKIEFAIFPNPTNGIFRIEFSNYLMDKASEKELIITNILGNEIMRMRVINKIEDIDLSKIKKGLYFVAFYDVNQLKTKKLILK